MTCIHMYTAHSYVHSTFVLIGNIKTDIFRCYTKHNEKSFMLLRHLHMILVKQ